MPENRSGRARKLADTASVRHCPPALYPLSANPSYVLVLWSWRRGADRGVDSGGGHWRMPIFRPSQAPSWPLHPALARVSHLCWWGLGPNNND